MGDKHPDQAEIAEYLAGVTDGDGTINVGFTKKDDLIVGYETSTRVAFKFYIAGLVDSEASLSVNIGKGADRKLGYRAKPQAYLAMIQKHGEEVEERFTTFLNELDVSYTSYERPMDNDDHNNQWVVSVESIYHVQTFLDAIEPHLVLKKQQAQIMLNEILPRMRNKQHLNKRGFLAIAAWRDVMNFTKGGLRGKYNLLYFEDEWDIQLDLERHDLPPELRDWIRSNQ